MRLFALVNQRWFVLSVCGAVLCYWLIFALRWNQTGWDLPVFYVAGALSMDQLYDRAAFKRYFEQHLAPMGVIHWARFVRLPIFSFVLHPLALLSYSHALWLWIGVCLVSYIAAVAVLITWFRLPRFMWIAYVSFFPAIVGLITGQDNCLLLLGLILGWMFLEQKRETLAGLAFTVCLCKYNLLVLMPVMLALQNRFRALGVFALGACIVAAVSFAITPLGQYVETLREVPNETAGFFPFGLRGLSLVVGRNSVYAVVAAGVLLLCCYLMSRLPLAEAFCVSLTGALLIVPYVCWYDSTLLAIPIALIYARNSTKVRAACVTVLILGFLWRYLLLHLAVEFSILACFTSLAQPVRARLSGRQLQNT